VKEPDAYLGAEVCKWTIDGLDDPAKRAGKVVDKKRVVSSHFFGYPVFDCQLNSEWDIAKNVSMDIVIRYP
jgi:hypothetical protein